jgi:single-strand DNA-binding protein
VIEQYAKKGRLVYVCGRLQTDEYTDEDGTKKFFTKIVASEVQFLDRAPDSEEMVKETEEESIPF